MRMILYDDMAKKIDFGDCKFLDCGSCGQIYKTNSDECLKFFYDDYPYQVEMFKIMKDLNLTNFYKIYNLFYKISGNFGGYTMKYYESDNLDILSMPIDYTLDNFNELLKQIALVSKNNILIEDMHDGNVIINNHDGIVVIDIDFYTLDMSRSQAEIEMLNNHSLYFLFSKLYISALYEYHKTEYFDKNNVDSLCEIFRVYETADAVCKKLKKYKYPIDYMRERK